MHTPEEFTQNVVDKLYPWPQWTTDESRAVDMYASVCRDTSSPLHVQWKGEIPRLITPSRWCLVDEIVFKIHELSQVERCIHAHIHRFLTCTQKEVEMDNIHIASTDSREKHHSNREMKQNMDFKCLIRLWHHYRPEENSMIQIEFINCNNSCIYT